MWLAARLRFVDSFSIILSQCLDKKPPGNRFITRKFNNDAAEAEEKSLMMYDLIGLNVKCWVIARERS